MIVLDAEMARVASIQRGSCVCLFYWHQLRARNNVCSCPLSGHSVGLSRTPLPVRLYRVMDEVGKRLPTYRPGTKWCISCRKNADKIFSTMDYYQMPRMRIRLCSNFVFSLWNEQGIFFSFSGFRGKSFYNTKQEIMKILLYKVRKNTYVKQLMLF